MRQRARCRSDTGGCSCSWWCRHPDSPPWQEGGGQQALGLGRTPTHRRALCSGRGPGRRPGRAHPPARVAARTPPPPAGLPATRSPSFPAESQQTRFSPCGSHRAGRSKQSAPRALAAPPPGACHLLGPSFPAPLPLTAGVKAESCLWPSARRLISPMGKPRRQEAPWPRGAPGGPWHAPGSA